MRAQELRTGDGDIRCAANGKHVTVTVTPSSTHAISPYIYGVNNANTSGVYPTGTASALPSNLTFDRLGGNRLTAYNWETNASNAGSDFTCTRTMVFSQGVFPLPRPPTLLLPTSLQD